jgi:hypothetical protein
MAKKKCGEITIKRLKNSGYTNRAIEDITFLAQKHGSTIKKIEQSFSQGYTPSQLDEIYNIARKYHQPPRIVQRFYDAFRPSPGKLTEMVEDIQTKRYSTTDIKLHQALTFVTNRGGPQGRDFNDITENLVEDIYDTRFVAFKEGENEDEEDEDEFDPQPDVLDELRSAAAHEVLGIDTAFNF